MRDFQHRAGETARMSDVDYYRRRAIQEQVAAQNAHCPTARKLHDELASMYRFRVSMLSDAWSEAGVAIALQRLGREQALTHLMRV
jgi:hypothetical protein